MDARTGWTPTLLTPTLARKINRLVELGAEQQCQLPGTNGCTGRPLLDTYHRDTQRFAFLTRDEESSLGRKIQCAEAARTELQETTVSPEERAELTEQIRAGKRAERRFIQSNLRLVIYWANKYQHRGLELLDLIQAGNIGLIRAVRRFDHTLGYKFSTYASWWIQQATRRTIADQA